MSGLVATASLKEFFKNLLEALFMERMDQNEEIVARYMNDEGLRDLVTGWLASETYRKLGGKPDAHVKYPNRKEVGIGRAKRGKTPRKRKRG